MTHPIEVESYRILRDRVDLSHFGPLSAAVVERVIHATADLEFSSSMSLDDQAVAAGVDALSWGAPVICDVEMVRAGITGTSALCYLSCARATDSGDTASRSHTLSAIAMRVAAREHPTGAVVVIGCAPTALFELVRLHRNEGFDPALVIGMPVGFVGAAESKDALRSTVLPAITNRGERGGSAAAAAALNAILRIAGRENGDAHRDTSGGGL